MLKVEPISTIRVGETVHQVAECSEQVQNLVDFYNDWREREADMRSQLLAMQAALRQVSNEILTQMQADLKAAEKAAEEAKADSAPAEVAEVAEDAVVVDEVADGGESA